MAILHEVFSAYSLKINVSKTKSQLYNSKYESREYPASISELNGNSVENVRVFRHLGALIHESEPTTGDAEIGNRIESAKGAFARHRNLLTNMSTNLHVRIQFLDSYVRSRLLYGCQCWSLNQRQIQRLNTCYRKFLLSMIRNGHSRASQTPGDYRLRYSNERILQICHKTDLIDFIRQQQASFLGHVARYDDNSIVKQLVYNADKYGRCGQPPITLESQVLKHRNVSRLEFYTSAREKLKDRSAGPAERPALQIR